MSSEYFYGTRTSAPKRGGKPSQPILPRGTAAAGRVVKLLVGQGYGFIRLPDDREIYFHRADMQEGTAFGDLRVGDTVKFELLEDKVSGARGLQVRRQQRRRR